MRPNNLSITPTPFKSSRLAIPPSPFSPLLPLHLPSRGANPSLEIHQTPHTPSITIELPPQPPQPLNWLWQCHKCARVYRLATTRRCLDDGHFFCAGTTSVKRQRRGGAGGGTRVVRHKACASEFDYQGWKVWGEWRREVEGLKSETKMNSHGEAQQKDSSKDLAVIDESASSDQMTLNLPIRIPNSLAGGAWTSDLWTSAIQPQPMPPRVQSRPKAKQKNCWANCNYPSECRWGKQQTPQQPNHETNSTTNTDFTEPPTTPPTLPQSTPPPRPPRPAKEPKTTFEEILMHLISLSEGDSAEAQQGAQSSTPIVSIPIVSEPVSPLSESAAGPSVVGSVDEAQPTEGEVLASAKRRYRLSKEMVHSPLASHPPERV